MFVESPRLNFLVRDEVQDGFANDWCGTAALGGVLIKRRMVSAVVL